MCICKHTSCINNPHPPAEGRQPCWLEHGWHKIKRISHWQGTILLVVIAKGVMVMNWCRWIDCNELPSNRREVEVAHCVWLSLEFIYYAKACKRSTCRLFLTFHLDTYGVVFLHLYLSKACSIWIAKWLFVWWHHRCESSVIFEPRSCSLLYFEKGWNSNQVIDDDFLLGEEEEYGQVNVETECLRWSIEFQGCQSSLFFKQCWWGHEGSPKVGHKITHSRSQRGLWHRFEVNLLIFMNYSLIGRQGGQVGACL